jgi:hypothetical protein
MVRMVAEVRSDYASDWPMGCIVQLDKAAAIFRHANWALIVEIGLDIPSFTASSAGPARICNPG